MQDRVFEQAKSYRFKMNDISKYSQTLNSKDTLWKFQLSAQGRKTPWNEDNINKKEKEEREINIIDMKNAIDWARAPLYAMHEQYGRWRPSPDWNIYSEVECKILHSHFKSLTSYDADDEGTFSKEHRKLIKKHKRKTMRTT